MNTPSKVLFLAVKNEGPFLLEWIAYHRVIGFDRIVIVSNDSDDGTTELLDALAAEGLVHHFHHSVSPDESPQGKAAAVANASGLINEGDWVLWLDADEFLNIHIGAGYLNDLLTAMDGARAMLIPWRLFGDSGKDGPPWRFVSTDFVHAARADSQFNRQVKTLFRAENATLSKKSPHRPAFQRGKGPDPAKVLTAAGRPVNQEDPVTRVWLAGGDTPGNAAISEEDFAWDLVQVNHYAVRTLSLFNLKRLRGRGWRGKRPVPGVRHTEKFYHRFNLRDVEDRSILRHFKATTNEINRMLMINSVRAAHEETLARTAARIAEMRGLPAEPEPVVPAKEAEPVLFAPEMIMPSDEAAVLARFYAERDVILEYGSGGSTLLAAGQDHSLIISVESDKAWVEKMQLVLDRDFPAAKVQLHWADIGPTGEWGHPLDQSAWKKYPLYPLGVWDKPWFRHPDLILIDGRFRVGCLLAALYRIERPVTVLFDDYATRQHYAKAVERFVKPVEIIGRMARFELEPTAYPVARMAEITTLMSRPL